MYLLPRLTLSAMHFHLRLAVFRWLCSEVLVFAASANATNIPTTLFVRYLPACAAAFYDINKRPARKNSQRHSFS